MGQIGLRFRFSVLIPCAVCFKVWVSQCVLGKKIPPPCFSPFPEQNPGCSPSANELSLRQQVIGPNTTNTLCAGITRVFDAPFLPKSTWKVGVYLVWGQLYILHFQPKCIKILRPKREVHLLCRCVLYSGNHGKFNFVHRWILQLGEEKSSLDLPTEITSVNSRVRHVKSQNTRGSPSIRDFRNTSSVHSTC